MNEKPVQGQKVFSTVTGLIVLFVALLSLYIEVEDAGVEEVGWFVFLAVLFNIIVLIIIFIELIDEAHIDTQKRLGIYIEPGTIKITSEMREKYKQCQTDEMLCNTQDDCKGCPADLPLEIHDALFFEEELNEMVVGGG